MTDYLNTDPFRLDGNDDGTVVLRCLQCVPLWYVAVCCPSETVALSFAHMRQRHRWSRVSDDRDAAYRQARAAGVAALEAYREPAIEGHQPLTTGERLRMQGDVVGVAAYPFLSSEQVLQGDIQRIVRSVVYLDTNPEDYQ